MIFNMQLEVIWYALVGILFTGYVILDGFDLGVGALHLFSKGDQNRRMMINSIGPVWDGNEVWLVTGGGALFAAFPKVYATVFSGFYLAFMLLLITLIFRAVAIEFRSKQASLVWRQFWDVSFSLSSLLSSFLIGVTLGNIVWGIPLSSEQDFYGKLPSLLHPYALAMGVMAVALFMMHGAIYIVMKTEGELQQLGKKWVHNAVIFFILCYSIVSMGTLLYVPHMSAPFKENPLFFLIPLFGILAIANIPREVYLKHEGRAFLSSCAAIVFLMALFGIGMFPNLVLSSPYPELSLTIYNAASSQKTLSIMLFIALLGIPLVLSYTVCIYWIFRGKVKLDENSY